MARKKRNKKAKRVTARRRRGSIRGIGAAKGGMMGAIMQAGKEMGMTAVGVMATDGIIQNLLKKENGDFTFSPKKDGVVDNKMGGTITGLVLSLAAAGGLTQIDNPLYRHALTGMGAEAMKVAFTSFMPNVKKSLGLGDVQENNDGYNGNPSDDDDEKIDWNQVAEDAMNDMQGVDDDEDEYEGDDEGEDEDNSDDDGDY